ncbi:MAG: YIP1 family protein [Sulfitobacter sp.]|nr:YIP1 family protein [Sulfitobacter sp.]
MTLSDTLKDLAVETLQSPRTAAQKIMALNLSRDVLWTGLVLAGATNSIIYSFSLLMSDTTMLPPLFRNPLMFFMLITGVLAVTVHAFYWTGRALGGRGDLGDLLALLVWLQGLRAVAQAVMFVLLLVSPVIGQLFSLVVGILGLWITVNFVTEALRLPGLMHAFGVLVLAAIGIVFGFAILVGLIGVAALGVPVNV